MRLFQSKEQNIISRAEKDLGKKCGELSELYEEFKKKEQDPGFEQSEEKTQLMDEISNLNASISTAFTDLERELEQGTGKQAGDWDEKTKDKIKRLIVKCGAAEKSMMQARAYETLSNKYNELEVDSTEKIEELREDYENQIDLLFNKNTQLEKNCKESDVYKGLEEDYKSTINNIRDEVKKQKVKCQKSFMCRGGTKRNISELLYLLKVAGPKVDDGGPADDGGPDDDGGDYNDGGPDDDGVSNDDDGGNGVQKLMGGSNKRKIVRSNHRRKSLKRKSTRRKSTRKRLTKKKSTRKRLTKKKSSRRKLSRRRRR